MPTITAANVNVIENKKSPPELLPRRLPVTAIRPNASVHQPRTVGFGADSPTSGSPRRARAKTITGRGLCLRAGKPKVRKMPANAANSLPYNYRGARAQRSLIRNGTSKMKTGALVMRLFLSTLFSTFSRFLNVYTSPWILKTQGHFFL